jgi:hypothetical protein
MSQEVGREGRKEGEKDKAGTSVLYTGPSWMIRHF